MDTLRTSPCNLCPRLCGVHRDRGEVGFCGADDTMLVARAALHFWEEPPLSGSRGSGAVFFTYCSLRCAYCQNAVIAAGDVGIPVTVERLADICCELEAQGALNINCVTPTHYALQVRKAILVARERGLSVPIVWNTSGYERVEAVQALSDTVDVYLTDFKYADAQLARVYSHAPDYPDVALAAIDAMLECTGEAEFDEVDGQPRLVRGVVVRHLLLPGALEQSKEALRLLHERFGDAVLYSIMNQYTPVISLRAEVGDTAATRMLEACPQLGSVVPASEYEQLLDYADELGMEDYFWQEGPAAEESFVPAWDGTGVQP